MKITTQRNLLAIALLGGMSGVAGTCVAQGRAPSPCEHDISVTASPSLLEAIAATCAAACPPADKCPDVSLTCCEEGPPAPVPCEPVDPVEVPLEVEPAGHSVLLDLTVIPQLQGAIFAAGWKNWERPIWIKAGVGTLRLDELIEIESGYSWGRYDYPATLALHPERSTVYTVGAVWLIKK